MKTLRKGKTKTLIESSIDCALLAVEIYNKPRVNFRVESFITNMVMAWTRLFHAYFNHSIGEKYFYKEGTRYKIIDGDRKAWELKTCIMKYGMLNDPVRINLELFIKLRNKIEHHCIDKDKIGIIIFGECQALLYNYENELIKLFGQDYAINESLAYSLQFSRIRTASQNKANKELLSNEVKELKTFIEKYRSNISTSVFDTQEYSIKLIQIPKITNTNKNDLAIEFVNWNSLSEDDKQNFESLTAIIKDKVIKTEALNVGKLKAGNVITKIADETDQKISHFDHKCLYYIFSIRPCLGDPDTDPFNTNTKYCHYDEAHADYLFKDEWVGFLVSNINNGALNKQFWKDSFDNKVKRNIAEFE
jgi:hypothetical protein